MHWDLQDRHQLPLPVSSLSVMLTCCVFTLMDGHINRARAFYGPYKAAPRNFDRAGEPTHLPMSHSFCSCRNYLQGKIPLVTSLAEILMTTIVAIGS